MSQESPGATGPAPPAGGGGGGDTGDGKSGDLSITSIALLVAPLVAALGLLTATGTIGRVQRDHPGLFAAAIGLVLVAGSIWVLVSLAKKKESVVVDSPDHRRRPRRGWLRLGHGTGHRAGG